MTTETTTETQTATELASTGKWSIVDAGVYDLALSLCRGSYQRSLVCGHENLSGSTLKGKAASYGAHYAASRSNLLRRLARKMIVEETSGAHNKRILVLRTA
jgi:hypothetical protein